MSHDVPMLDLPERGLPHEGRMRGMAAVVQR